MFRYFVCYTLPSYLVIFDTLKTAESFNSVMVIVAKVSDVSHEPRVVFLFNLKKIIY